MNCFVEDLLSYNMIQEGAFVLNNVKFNPCDILKFIANTFNPKLVGSTVKIRTGFVSSPEDHASRMSEQFKQLKAREEASQSIISSRSKKSGPLLPSRQSEL